jgi:hypothetical protein
MSEDIAPRPMVLQEFLPLVGKRFVANCDPAEVEITLFDASPLKDHGIADRPPFLLIFHTPPEIRLLDGTYVLKCGKWGPDMVSMSSLIPPANSPPGFYYQAVFN